MEKIKRPKFEAGYWYLFTDRGFDFTALDKEKQKRFLKSGKKLFLISANFERLSFIEVEFEGYEETILIRKNRDKVKILKNDRQLNEWRNSELRMFKRLHQDKERLDNILATRELGK